MNRIRSGAVATVALLVGGLVTGIGGSASAAASTWTQNGDITIPAGLSYASSGGPATIVDVSPASIYPWTITVPDIGQVTDVNVTLTGLDHSYVGDLDVLLVGPGGEQVMLVGDPGDGRSVTATGIELTLDDEATNPLPNPDTAGAYPGGTYRPANHDDSWGGDDVFPSPAPPGTPGTALSVFDGTAALGAWQLYVRDDGGPNAGSLDGWSLSFTTDTDTVTSPYPSEVTVSGLTSVRDVNLTLTGVDHPNAADLDVLLVGPDGDQAVVLSDAGGDQPVTAATLTLDDEATTPLPDTAALTSGTWQPANHGTGPDVFPGVTLAPGVGSALDVFDGTDPNGTWQLYVLGDNAELIDGMIDGWSLEITTDQAAPTGTVSINNAAATTTAATVTLALDATDPTPDASGMDSMRFSNNGTDWSPWQDYATTTPWTLTTGDGLKTVHAQFRDEAGNISTGEITDTITLTTPAAPAPAPAPAPARDTVSPTWVRFTPAKKAKAVSRSTSIKVVISEDLDPATITRTTVYLKRRDTDRKVNATVSYDPATDTITINPNKLLRAETNYRVTLGIGTHDLAGNQFDGNTTVSGFQNHRWNFTTTD